MLDNMKVVAIEEHFWIEALRPKALIDRAASDALARRLLDLDDLRLHDLDEAGIDVQVISHGPSRLQTMPAAEAVATARTVNDRLHDAILRHPDRFAGFASLPTPDPEAAARELERTVKNYGFKGAIVTGLTNAGEFLDDRKYWAIFDAAAALDVPVYIHPGSPHAGVCEAYYAGYPEMLAAGMAFTFETAVHAVRLVMSGLFDTYPALQMIIGHLGEALPYLLWRSDVALSRNTRLKKRFRDYFVANFSVTTSGTFSNAALTCAITEMGIDRIMFAVDWPYTSNMEAIEFMRKAPLSASQREKILASNAAALLGL